MFLMLIAFYQEIRMRQKQVLSALKKVIAQEDDKFKTKIDDITIYDDAILAKQLNLDTDDIRIKKVILVWEYSMVLRSYGIASLFPVVPDQKIYIEGVSTDADGDDVGFSEDLEIKDVEVEYGSSEGIHDLGLVPVEMEFHKGKWTVKFHIGSV